MTIEGDEQGRGFAKGWRVDIDYGGLFGWIDKGSIDLWVEDRNL